MFCAYYLLPHDGIRLIIIEEANLRLPVRLAGVNTKLNWWKEFHCNTRCTPMRFRTIDLRSLVDPFPEWSCNHPDILPTWTIKIDPRWTCRMLTVISRISREYSTIFVLVDGSYLCMVLIVVSYKELILYITNFECIEGWKKSEKRRHHYHTKPLGHCTSWKPFNWFCYSRSL